MSDQVDGSTLPSDASVGKLRDHNGNLPMQAKTGASITDNLLENLERAPTSAASSHRSQNSDSMSDLAAAQAPVSAPADTLPDGPGITTQPIQSPKSSVHSEHGAATEAPFVNGTRSTQSLTTIADPPQPALVTSESAGRPYDTEEEPHIGATAAILAEKTGTAKSQPSRGSTHGLPTGQPGPIVSSSVGAPSSDAMVHSKENILSPNDAGVQNAGTDTSLLIGTNGSAPSIPQSSISEPVSVIGESTEVLTAPLNSLVANAATPSSSIKAETTMTQDVVMSDGTMSSAVTPAVAGLGGFSSQVSPVTPLSNEASEPPAKKQKFPPPTPQQSASVTADSTQISMTQAQVKFAQNSIKSLKQRPESPAFLVPVDPIALNIPQYRQIIEHPMDLGTIDVKLALTASALKGGKPTEKTKAAAQFGLDPARDFYANVQQWEDDVRLVFLNCIRFNGPDHAISQSAKALAAVFEKQLNSMPIELPAGASTVVEAAAEPASPDEKKARRPSNPVPAIRRSSTDASGRPKREIHPPAPRDLPYADEPQSASSGRKKKKKKTLTPRQQLYLAKVNQQELNFCSKVIDDILTKHADHAWVFIDVPARTLDWAPAYYATIKRPIAFQQIQDKHRRHEYADKDDLLADVKLMFQNCYTFNPPGDDVYKMGKRIESIFDDKIKKMPKPKPMTPEPEDDADEDAEYDLDEEQRLRNEKIRQLEEQLAELKRETRAVKAKAASKRKPRASTSGSGAGAFSSKKSSSSKVKASGVHDGSGGTKKTKKASKSMHVGEGSDEDNDVRAVTWEQKEELASKITQLSDERLDGALQIISEDKPPNANEDEEIELDIEDLSPRTLYKLYRYVVKPKKKPGPKPGTVKGNKAAKAATGGKKRKNLDEEEEAARIARLQEQLQSFDRAPEADGLDAGRIASRPAVGTGVHDDLVHSDSSSGEEDSDGSESDY